MGMSLVLLLKQSIGHAEIRPDGDAVEQKLMDHQSCVIHPEGDMNLCTNMAKNLFPPASILSNKRGNDMQQTPQAEHESWMLWFMFKELITRSPGCPTFLLF